MGAEIKFCGLTRAADAAHAVALGAAYTGAIFAGGPRELDAARARDVFAGVPASVSRVGVFADQSPTEIAQIARVAGIEIAQLHGGFSASRLEAVRDVFDGELWAVVRVSGSHLPSDAASAFELADGVVLDTFVPGQLGGTGVALPWDAIADALNELRGGTPLILAGGLGPENVAQAIAALSPDVVDVSSGVEAAPGIKDHDRMRAFRDAVVNAPIAR